MRVAALIVVALLSGCATAPVVSRPYNQGDELTKLSVAVECLTTTIATQEGPTTAKDCRVRSIAVNDEQQASYSTGLGPKPSLLFRAWEARWEPKE